MAAMGAPMQMSELPMHTKSSPCLPMAAMGAPMQVLHLQQSQEIVNYPQNCQKPILGVSMYQPDVYPCPELNSNSKEEKALQMVEGKKNVSTTIPPTIPKDVPASPTIIEELSTDEDLPALLSDEEETQLPLKKRRIVKKKSRNP
ncbi:Hypothetical predicted protein [Mytilus galloprovincialis]|uniref:Uncharacterized protein n=1 Tax=Mytilus galloprovincialis TaxID=29158 RepID=A0A8B6HDH8_MYTGA|nr:Hypothetical predicted protein [Mytilus galloprovincialis]